MSIRYWLTHQFARWSRSRFFRTRGRSATIARAAAVIERLEPRILLTTVTAYEEYFLALINRARQDPVVEATRLGIDLNEGLTAGTLAPGARQPLALNDDLQAAIEGHILDELTNNYFSHTGSDNSTPQTRITASGYTNWTTIGENLALEYSTGPLPITQAVVTDEYNNLFIDTSEPGRGHRINIVNGSFVEVGSAVKAGLYQGDNAVDSGNDFGARQGNSFLTGVIFTDSVTANSFYDVGEGIGGASVVVTGAGNTTYQTTANSAGGYQIQLPAGSYSVTFSGTGISSPITKTFTIGSLNVEVDANTKTDIVAGGPPALSGTNPINYLAGSSPTAIDSNILITDPNRLSLSTASVTIGNFVAGQDVLGFVPNAGTMGNIAVSSNTNGVLSLSSSGATATLAQWQTALRVVTYSNSNNIPATTTRNVTIVVDDGTASNHLSNTLSTTISLSLVNNPPQLTGLSGNVTYVTTTAPMSIAPNLVVSQSNNVSIASATISFTNWQAGDRLQFSNTYALQHTFAEDDTANTASLTITGVATAAQYQTTLRSSQFWVVAGSPVTWLQRIATFTVTNVYSNSGSATENIEVNPVANSALPVVSGVVAPVTYVESTSPIYIATNLVVTQPSGLNIYSATISFTNWEPGDRLQFTNSFALQHTAVENLTNNTYVLTLTGFATAAQYQATLRSLQFWTVAASPVTWLQRIATISVTDIYSNTGSATQNVEVNPAANIAPPAVTGVSGPVTYVESGSPVTITPNLVITDSVNIYGARVSFTNWEPGDRLQFTNSFALQHTAVENLTNNTYVLTLSGVATPAQYQATLRTMQFWTVAGSPVTWLQRVATIAVTDIYSNTGSATQNVEVNPAANIAPPAVTGVSGPVIYVESASPVTMTPNLVVNNSVNIYNATVSFTNWEPGDRLQFTNSFALQHTAVENLTNNTYVLTLSGIATPAQYQATLRTLQYWTVAGSPVTWLQRIATISVTDIYSNTGSATQNVEVNPVANSSPPTVTGVGTTVNYSQSASPVTIAPNLVVSQPNGLTLYSATVSFTNWQPGDRLQFDNSFAMQHMFTENDTNNTATLVLTGFNTATQYQATLRSMTFYDVSGALNTSTRVATITITDIYSNSGSGTQSIAVSH